MSAVSNEIGKKDYDELMSLFEACEGSDELSEWERGFCADLKHKIVKYKHKAYISTKQWDVIDKIMDKL